MAVNYQDLTERYLERLCRRLDVTSAWLCQHDFELRVATVVACYVMVEANAVERQEDLGETFSENDGSAMWSWLHSERPEPYAIHIDELPPASPDRLEYIENGAYSVLYLPVYVDEKIWGFVEVWESRQKHFFQEKDIQAAQAIMSDLSAAIE